ncbi:hypothetical protein GM658_28365 [Pseudoduganella eburnea]|uniref:Uncharacterized protein n=1 Tax=Massilia eburnea TaxID=1776165 RepID=A0A6L6QQS4_9BURK|nr:hypothetical protein [Massilia eburnea]MTW14535.1 hypothetical protein [Massilia eburnea]
MEADSPDHEKRFRELERKVPDLACEMKLLGAELRTAIATAIAESETRMRAYVDSRLAELEQRLTARIVALEKGQHWIMGLLISLLIAVIGGMAGVIGVLTQILEKLA